MGRTRTWSARSAPRLAIAGLLLGGCVAAHGGLGDGGLPTEGDPGEATCLMRTVEEWWDLENTPALLILHVEPAKRTGCLQLGLRSPLRGSPFPTVETPAETEVAFLRWVDATCETLGDRQGIPPEGALLEEALDADGWVALEGFEDPALNPLGGWMATDIRATFDVPGDDPKGVSEVEILRTEPFPRGTCAAP